MAGVESNDFFDVGKPLAQILWHGIKRLAGANAGTAVGMGGTEFPTPEYPGVNTEETKAPPAQAKPPETVLQPKPREPNLAGGAASKPAEKAAGQPQVTTYENPVPGNAWNIGVIPGTNGVGGYSTGVAGPIPSNVHHFLVNADANIPPNATKEMVYDPRKKAFVTTITTPAMAAPAMPATPPAPTGVHTAPAQGVGGPPFHEPLGITTGTRGGPENTDVANAANVGDLTTGAAANNYMLGGRGVGNGDPADRAMQIMEQIRQRTGGFDPKGNGRWSPATMATVIPHIMQAFTGEKHVDLENLTRRALITEAVARTGLEQNRVGLEAQRVEAELARYRIDQKKLEENPAWLQRAIEMSMVNKPFTDPLTGETKYQKEFDRTKFNQAAKDAMAMQKGQPIEEVKTKLKPLTQTDIGEAKKKFGSDAAKAKQWLKEQGFDVDGGIK